MVDGIIAQRVCANKQVHAAPGVFGVGFAGPLDGFGTRLQLIGLENVVKNGSVFLPYLVPFVDYLRRVLVDVLHFVAG